MTSQQQLVCDSSTLANFKQWAQAISTFFSTAGWVQTSDTGQVNWSSIASVPGSGAYVYEVWKPGDALTVFYVKIEYGNVSGTNCPSLRLSLGTTTNGAGTLTGFNFGPVNTNMSAFTPPSTTTQFECDFSGSASRICVMMWRNGTGNCQQFFGVERSVDGTGAYTGTYATLWTAGLCPNAHNTSQRSLVFAIGAGPNMPNGQSATGSWVVRFMSTTAQTSFNGSIPFDLSSPSVGYYDYPCTIAGMISGLDISEGVTFTATLYGTTRTYMPSFAGPFANAVMAQPNCGLCMRYD
jgi:hypothetical protein